MRAIPHVISVFFFALSAGIGPPAIAQGANEGTIGFGFQGISITVKGPNGIQRVEGASGKLRLPSGEYQVQSAEAYGDDARGRRWRMSLGFKWENSLFRVEPGRQTKLLCGGPLSYSGRRFQGYRRVIAVMYDTSQAHDVPDPDPREIGIQLNLIDAYGNHVGAVRRPDGTLAPAATMHVSDGAGRPVAKCSFKYG